MLINLCDCHIPGNTFGNCLWWCFILVKDTIIATEQKQLETDREIIWVKLDIVATKPLYNAKEGDAQSLEELDKSLENKYEEGQHMSLGRLHISQVLMGF